jgi:hypothetical protein
MTLVGRVIQIIILLAIFNLDLFDFTGNRGVANLVDSCFTGRALVFGVLNPFYDARPTKLMGAVVEFCQVL